jgi:hypothetical protein
LLADFEFQIYYKKNNENDETDTLSRWFDHEKVKWVYTEIYLKTMKFLQKLAAMYRVENASLMNDKLIWECYNNRTDEHLEVKWTENLV